ncbi:hypothetical protein BT96DRAFT_241359 [Gymnopus androsaceus JB14]|uniref:Uncharacterized protein n=1 Tax=Gymnopus androsaceus JB14 TaxID=1447944 RepID=A0A6A4IJY7_9AGAR|nr:hypothetical protein BT96DRAFT_241359 [Gymnopus androsaceus JB14]
MNDSVVSLAESTKSLVRIVSPQLQIVQEIRRYENAIRELKSRYNLLTPIAILPRNSLCISCFSPTRPKGYSNGTKYIASLRCNAHLLSCVNCLGMFSIVG